MFEFFIRNKHTLLERFKDEGYVFVLTTHHETRTCENVLHVGGEKKEFLFKLLISKNLINLYIYISGDQWAKVISCSSHTVQPENHTLGLKSLGCI